MSNSAPQPLQLDDRVPADRRPSVGRPPDSGRMRSTTAPDSAPLIPHFRRGQDRQYVPDYTSAPPSTPPLVGDPRLLQCLAVNLVDNAIGHNISGGHIHISTDATDTTDGAPV